MWVDCPDCAKHRQTPVSRTKSSKKVPRREKINEKAKNTARHTLCDAKSVSDSEGRNNNNIFRVSPCGRGDESRERAERAPPPMSTG